MNHGNSKRRMILALLVGLAATVAVLFLLSTSNIRAATLAVNSAADSDPVARQGHERITVATPLTNVRSTITWDNQVAGDGAEACTVAVATGSATVDGRPVLWKNRDFYRSGAWQSILFWHTATGSNFSTSEIITDRFDYVAVSDRGDWSDSQDITETLYYPRMGVNERGLGVVSAQAHTLSDDIQQAEVYTQSQDPNGVWNGGLNHWLLSRCETITEVAQLLTETNDGGGYNGSSARNTASLIAVIDRSGGAAIFEVDGNSFARQNITKEFAGTLDVRPHSVGPPAEGYNGFDYRSNFSRITFTNTKVCSPTKCFPYFPDEDNDGVNDFEYSESSKRRWGRVSKRMDDADKDYQYFIQKWLRTGGQPREYYLEIIARSVGYAPYLSESADYAWLQEKPVGYHLNRFVTVSSAIIVGSKADDPDKGRLATMWVALGEPSVAIFVPVFPYADQPPSVLDDFFLSINAKRRLVYDYETDGRYPIDNIDTISSYTRLRNHDHSIDLSALFGGNYYGEGGLQAYNFAIEERLFEEYSQAMDRWRARPITEITPLTLSAWQEHWVNWAVGEYVKSDPTVVVYEAETDFEHTSGQITTSNTITAWQFLQDGYMSLSYTHDFAGPTIIEVIARGIPDDGEWPRMRVWISGTPSISLTEVGGETGTDYTVVVSPAHATNKAKGSDVITLTSRFALYRYRTVYTGTAELRVEIVSATVSATADVDKVLLRTEPCSVEMYEVEKDWDYMSATGVDIWQTYVRIHDPDGYFDTYHYIWGKPLTTEVAIARVDPEPPWPEMGLYYTRTTADSGWKQIGVTVTLDTSYTVYSFYLPTPDFEGEAAFRIRSGNDSSIRVDKLLVKESHPLTNPNTAPTGRFIVDSTFSGPTVTITATAVVTDPDGDAIASYFWDFGDRKSYCSGNPVVTHTYNVTETPYITLHATDHRGKTAVISSSLSFVTVTHVTSTTAVVSWQTNPAAESHLDLGSAIYSVFPNPRPISQTLQGVAYAPGEYGAYLDWIDRALVTSTIVNDVRAIANANFNAIILYPTEPATPTIHPWDQVALDAAAAQELPIAFRLEWYTKSTFDWGAEDCDAILDHYDAYLSYFEEHPDRLLYFLINMPLDDPSILNPDPTIGRQRSYVAHCYDALKTRIPAATVYANTYYGWRDELHQAPVGDLVDGVSVVIYAQHADDAPFDCDGIPTAHGPASTLFCKDQFDYYLDKAWDENDLAALGRPFVLDATGFAPAASYDDPTQMNGITNDSWAKVKAIEALRRYLERDARLYGWSYFKLLHKDEADWGLIDRRRITSPTITTTHRLTLTDLFPVTPYTFTVGTDCTASGIHTFATSPPPAETNTPPWITIMRPPYGHELVPFGGQLTITWDDDDPDDNAVIGLYYDTDDTGCDGTMIVENLSEDSAADVFTWPLPTALPTGSYYIYGQISDGVNPTECDYSSGRFVPSIETLPVVFAWETITVDGAMDEAIWQHAIPLTYAVHVSQTDVTTATARALWDRDYLYVGFAVQDTQVETSALDWNDDSVSIIFNNGEFRCRQDVGGTGEGTCDRALHLPTCTALDDSNDTDCGYTVEMRVQWSRGRITANANDVLPTDLLSVDHDGNPGAPYTDTEFSKLSWDGDNNVDTTGRSITLGVNPTGVTLDGPTVVRTGQPYTFTATVSPITTTLPITYTWQATGPGDITTTTFSLSNTISFTWHTTGSKVITITAANTVGTVSDTHIITVNVSPTDVVIDGPTVGRAGQPYTFTATVSPVTTALPITYIWQATGQNTMTATTYSLSNTASFTWTTAGSKVVTVAAVNAVGIVSDTHAITINIPPTGVDIDGPKTGLVHVGYTFTATVSPSTTTLPISYIWQATGQNTMTTTTYSLSNTVSFTWHLAGTKIITVIAANTVGVATDTHTIVICPCEIYLPLVMRNGP